MFCWVVRCWLIILFTMIQKKNSYAISLWWLAHICGALLSFGLVSYQLSAFYLYRNTKEFIIFKQSHVNEKKKSPCRNTGWQTRMMLNFLENKDCIFMQFDFEHGCTSDPVLSTEKHSSHFLHMVHCVALD